jgi:hypothetical protein
MGELSQIVTRLLVDDKEAQAVLQRYGVTAQMLTKNLDQLEKSNQRVGSGFVQVGHEAAQARMSLMSLNYIVIDLPYGFRGIANNMDMSVQSLVLLIQTSGGAMGALKALGTSLTGGMGILFAFTAITSAIQIAQYGIMSFGKGSGVAKEGVTALKLEVEALTKALDRYKEKLGWRTDEVGTFSEHRLKSELDQSTKNQVEIQRRIDAVDKKRVTATGDPLAKLDEEKKGLENNLKTEEDYARTISKELDMRNNSATLQKLEYELNEKNVTAYR